MTRWEYIRRDAARVEEFNALGQDGWELVGIEPLKTEDGKQRCIFKRPRPAQDHREAFGEALQEIFDQQKTQSPPSNAEQRFLEKLHNLRAVRSMCEAKPRVRTCKKFGCDVDLTWYGPFCTLHACDQPFCTETAVGNARCRKHTIEKERWRCNKSRSVTQTVPCPNAAYAVGGFCSEHTCDYENCYAERLEGRLVCGAHSR